VQQVGRKLGDRSIKAVREYTGNDLLKFIISVNLHRRHLNETQRAVIASRIANIRLGEAHRPDKVGKFADLPNPINQSQAAEMLNISDRTLRNIKPVPKKNQFLYQHSQT